MQLDSEPKGSLVIRQRDGRMVRGDWNLGETAETLSLKKNCSKALGEGSHEA